MKKDVRSTKVRETEESQEKDNEVPLSCLFSKKRRKGSNGKERKKKKRAEPEVEVMPSDLGSDKEETEKEEVVVTPPRKQGRKNVRVSSESVVVTRSRGVRKDVETDEKGSNLSTEAVKCRKEANLGSKKGKDTEIGKKDVESDEKGSRSEAGKCKKESNLGLKKGKESESGKKRSRLDIFDVTEDDLVDVDITKTKKETGAERGGSVVTDKKKRTNFDKKSGLSVEREKESLNLGKKKSERKEDGSAVRASKKETETGSGEIVLANKKNQSKFDKKSWSSVEREKEGRSLDKKKSEIKEDGNSDTVRKLRERSGGHVVESVNLQAKKKTENNQLSSKNSLSTKKGKGSHQRTEDDMGTCNSENEDANEGEITPKKKKARHGNRLTQKNSIRDKIQEMVIDAGWTIERKPRKGRDYLDTIYVDLSGHGHWSCVKAYYELEKECQKNGRSFTPLPEESLSIMLRVTKKRMEREKRMKGGSKNAKATVIKKNKHHKKSKGISMNGGKVKVNSLGMKKKKKVGSANEVHSQEERKKKKHNGRALLARNSDKDSDYTGKRTVLTWLIDSGIVPPSGKVKYMNKRQTRALLEGSITLEGIHCGCCNKIVTLSEFEIHAGSKLRQPFQNIFLETGVSLYKCQLDAWNKVDESERKGYHCIDFNSNDPNDDTCGMCGDGGDLICCDGCPSTFHQSCLDIQVLPSGDWLCSNCSCKFCRVTGQNEDQGNDIITPKLLTCSLCEEKYHKSCIPQINMSPTGSDSLCTSFCGQECRELLTKLCKIVGVRHELEDGLSWILLQRSDLETKMSIDEHSHKVKLNSKLAVAVSVMEECFLPITDCRSGINMIHSVLYNCGSNCSRLNYSGFYTAILERDDEVTCVASIRIHGIRLAEMPFIGTRHVYRRQGLCRQLLNAIESTLCSLNVEKLVIPAISELTQTWTKNFGFKPLGESHKKEIKSINMLVFPGVDMLEKIVLKNNVSEENITNESVAKSIEPNEEHHSTPEVNNESDGDSVMPDNLISHESVSHNSHGMSNNVDAAETGKHAPNLLVHDVTDGKSSISVDTRGPLAYAFDGENEPESQAVGMTPVLPEPEPMRKSIIEVQESTEGDFGDDHEVNMKSAGINSGLQSDGIPVQQTVHVVNEQLDIVSGSIICGANEHNKSDYYHQNVCKMDCTSGKVSHVVSDTAQCDESATKESDELTESHVVRHDVSASDVHVLQKIENVCGRDEGFPDTGRGETEVAASECNPQANGEDSVDCTSEVVNKTFSSVTKCNTTASVKCRSHDTAPNSSNSSSQALPSVSEAACDRAVDVKDDSSGAFRTDSTVLASHTCVRKAEHLSMGHSEHVSEASSPVSSVAAAESILKVTSGNSKLSNKELLHEAQDLTSSVVQNILPVGANPRGFVGDATLGTQNIKDEVTIVEFNASAAKDDHQHETSEVISNDRNRSDS